MDLDLRQRFHLPLDLWAGRHIETADAQRAAALVDAAVRAQAMVSIAGPRGSGKTHTVRRTLPGAGARVVEPQRLDRERLHLGDIATAMVRDLSDERPWHSAEARTQQVRRLLGQAGGSVVLLIDDAHVLHHRTLRGLKRLRELSWRGRSPLLGIVLLGQLDKTASVPEVGLRTARASFGGLTQAEAAAALDAACGAVLGPGAAARLAAADRARNWLDLSALVDDVLREAAARGERIATVATVEAALGAADGKTDQPEPEQVDQGAASERLTQLLGKGGAVRRSA